MESLKSTDAAAPTAVKGAAVAAAAAVVAGGKEWLEKFLGSVPGGVAADVGLDYLESIVQHSITNNPVIRDRVREILEHIPVNKMGTINSVAISLIARKVEAMPGLDHNTRRFFTNAVRELADSVKDGVSDVSKYKTLVHNAVDAAAVETVSTTTGPLAGYTPEMPGAAHVVVRQVDGALAFECMLAIGGKVKVYGENRKTFADGVRIGTCEEILALTHGNACPLCLGRRPVETTAAGEHAVHGAVAHTEDKVKTWFKDVGFIGVTVAMALVKTASTRAKDRFVSEDYLRELSTVDIEAWRAAAMQVFPRIIQKPDKPVHGTLTAADHDFLFTLIKGVGQGSLEPSSQLRRVLSRVYDWFTSRTRSLFTADRLFKGTLVVTSLYVLAIPLVVLAYLWGALWVDTLTTAACLVGAASIITLILLQPVKFLEKAMIVIANLFLKKDEEMKPGELVKGAWGVGGFAAVWGAFTALYLMGGHWWGVIDLDDTSVKASTAMLTLGSYSKLFTTGRYLVAFVIPLLIVGTSYVGKYAGAHRLLQRLTRRATLQTARFRKLLTVGALGILLVPLAVMLWIWLSPHLTAMGESVESAGNAIIQRLDKTTDSKTEPPANQVPNQTPSTPSTAGKTKVATNTKADMARRLQVKLCPDPDLDPDYRRALRCP